MLHTVWPVDSPTTRWPRAGEHPEISQATELLQDPGLDSEVRKAAAEHRVWLMRDHAGQPVATATLTTVETTLHLDHLALRRDRNVQKLVSLISQWCLYWARAERLTRAEVHLRPANDDLLGRFQQLGWENTGQPHRLIKATTDAPRCLPADLAACPPGGLITEPQDHALPDPSRVPIGD